MYRKNYDCFKDIKDFLQTHTHPLLTSRKKDFLQVFQQKFTHPKVSAVQINLRYLILFLPDEVTDFLSVAVFPTVSYLSGDCVF